MSSKNYEIKLSRKLRELELVMKNITESANPDNIDIDIALEKTREIYSMLLIIRNDSSKKEDEKREGDEEKSPVPADPEVTESEAGRFFEVENRIPGISDKEKKDLEIEEESETQLEEPDRKESGEKDKEEENMRKDEDTGSENGKKRKADILADKYTDSQNHVNEALAEKRKGDNITSRLQNRPIRDLRDSIGLNEKFLFIRKLFGNNPDTYNQCIDFLNNASSYQEAEDYLKESFSWDEDNEIAEKLFNLVKRKHQKE